MKLTGTNASAKLVRSSLQNQKMSPLLRLPREIRNRIYDYAFSVQFTIVRNNPSYPTRLTFRAGDAYPLLKRNSFAKLLAVTRVCRQIYSEAALLPFRLNVFRIHQLATLVKFTEYMQPAQRAAITTLRLGLYDAMRKDTLAVCDLGPFQALKRVIVETKFAPWVCREVPNWLEVYHQAWRKALKASSGRDIDVIFA